MRSIISSSLTCIALSAAIMDATAQGTWQPRSGLPMGNGRWGTATFVINGIGYSAGGYTGSTDLNDVKAYDPSTDSWTTRSPLPVALRLASGFAINGKGFVACGLIGTSSHQSGLYMYDPATDTWSTRASFPSSARYGMASFTVNGIGYVVCGNSGGATGSYHTELYAYDPVTNTWTQRASYPGMERFACSGFSIGNKGYVFGGRRDDQTFSNELYEYDPVTNTWTQRPSMPAIGRSYATTTSAGGHGYVFAGSDLANVGITDCWAYQQSSNTWSQVASYPGSGYWGGTAFSMNNRLFCGLGRFNNTIPTEFFEFTSPYVGMEELSALEALTMWPNPCVVDGPLYMTPPAGTGLHQLEVVVLDALGRSVIRQRPQDNGVLAVTMPELGPGTYLVQLHVAGRPRSQGTLVVSGQR